MTTLDGYPNLVYLSASEWLFYTTAKQTIKSLEDCIKLAKTPEQKLALFKRRNQLSQNYNKMLESINGREVCHV